MNMRMEALSARMNRKQSSGTALVRKAGVGMAWVLWMVAVEAEAQAAKAAVTSPVVQAPVAQVPVAKEAKGAPAAKGEFTRPLVQKAETPEVKARRENNAKSAKAFQASSDRLTGQFVKMAGEREAARKAEEKARKTSNGLPAEIKPAK